MRLYEDSTFPVKLELGILESSRGLLVSTLADRNDNSCECEGCRRVLRLGVSEPARGRVASG
jgi:hypothetical protein